MGRKIRKVSKALTRGTLTPGQWCEGVTVGTTATGLIAFRSTFAGRFEETRPSEWDGVMYSYFRGGQIGGTAQNGLHGGPADRWVAPVELAVTIMKGEILELIAEGRIPADVSSFSELHDYIDANMLAEEMTQGPSDDETDEEAEARMDANLAIMNPAQDAVNAWLAAGRPEQERTQP